MIGCVSFSKSGRPPVNKTYHSHSEKKKKWKQASENMSQNKQNWFRSLIFFDDWTEKGISNLGICCWFGNQHQNSVTVSVHYLVQEGVERELIERELLVLSVLSWKWVHPLPVHLHLDNLTCISIGCSQLLYFNAVSLECKAHNSAHCFIIKKNPPPKKGGMKEL